MRKVPPKISICASCLLPFEHFRYQKRKFCSKICYGKTNKGNNNPAKRLEIREKIRISKLGDKNAMFGKRGDKCPNYKGNRELKVSIRGMIESVNWTKSVFKRDNYTCQECGRKRRVGDRVILESHHIKPFSEILIENNIKTIEDARNCSKLWDVNNGITLCKECHKKITNYKSYHLRKEKVIMTIDKLGRFTGRIPAITT